MQVFRQWSGVIASLILALCGGFLAGVLGIMMVVLGLASAAYQAWMIRKAAGDPYDLNKLWDSPLPEDIQPEDALQEPENAYCHRCNHIVPEGYARCPDCGERVR